MCVIPCHLEDLAVIDLLNIVCTAVSISHQAALAMSCTVALISFASQQSGLPLGARLAEEF